MLAIEEGSGLAHALVWRFPYEEADGATRWTGEVDAHNGSIRAFYEATQYPAVRGGGVPIGPDGDCAGGGCETAVFPMPFADIVESGEPAHYGDEFGNYTSADPTPTVDLVLSWSPVAGAAGYHVLQSEVPSFLTDVSLLGATTGTTLTLPNGASTTPAVA